MTASLPQSFSIAMYSALPAIPTCSGSEDDKQTQYQWPEHALSHATRSDATNLALHPTGIFLGAMRRFVPVPDRSCVMQCSCPLRLWPGEERPSLLGQVSHRASTLPLRGISKALGLTPEDELIYTFRRRFRRGSWNQS
jgi:hypothetical protein